ncbi:hypothetical protein SDC9_153706 [bioreactor metagenome]|uniref:Uncharacterized protein n=1 Tax=bioreactor metagenome TaxID=1076179 RepID=A0A645EYA2_9ZZZZ
MTMTIRTANHRSTKTSANTVEAHSFCSRFMSASVILFEDAIIVASIFVVLLTLALFVRVLTPAVFVLLVGVTLIISCDNLIARHKMPEPQS